MVVSAIRPKEENSKMSAKKFRFVSPGIFLNEIDKSLLPKEGAPVGPVVIGRTERGPGLRPVTVNSFLEFTQIFGNPIPGGNTSDVWRNGNRTSPTYASYAARAWLKNGTPLTVVRVLGAASPDADPTTGVAGWKTENSPNVLASDNGGAFGLFVSPQVPSGADPINGTLAAIWYLDQGSIRLAGEGQSGSTVGASGSGAGQLVKCNGSDFQFKAIITNAEDNSVLTSSFNFDASSDKYIRKVFSTNPTLLGSDNGSPIEYFLGESFDSSLKKTLPASAAGAEGSMAFIVALKGADDRQKDSQPAESGMVISQTTGDPGEALEPKDLFKFVALDSGEWINSNVKVSIRDIAPSTNPDFSPFGTFTVEVRDARDTDAKKVVLETFSGCNLDPDSTNYIGAKIGNKYATWNSTDRRFTEFGDYDNKSAYIYVDTSILDNKHPGETLLPFGFKGPSTYADLTGVINTSLGDFGEVDIPHAPSNTFVSGGGGANNPLTMSGPQMSLRLSSSTGGFSDPTDAYWGVTTDAPGTTVFDGSYADMAGMLPSVNDDYIKADTFTFSLDNVTYVSSSTTGIVEWQARYGSDLYENDLSINAGGDTPDGPLSASYENVLNAGLNRFTMPMVGGFDGLDIKHRDPLSNAILSEKDELTSYAFNSIKRSIDSVSDPEVVEMNVATVPGVTNESLTNHLVQVCETRADCLAIIDLPGGYETEYESSAEASERVGSVDATVTALKNRAMNSSYACSYYPWVQSKDEFGSGKVLWLPPSVAALGTFASNDRKSAPWFAPAGFTRGGLSDGAAGIPVIGVREHLTRKMRDKLYDNNVNPIAKFPAEGIVIFGQKTMQAVPSALDRVNVRRMLLHVKKGISNISSTLLFDQNVKTTWARFLGEAEPFLRDVQAQLGLTEYKIVLDETTTTPDLIDRNIMYAKIFLKPARSIEFIAIDFVIQRTGASFED
tara:strand:- start:16253 stop:19108 length:2856 start_codon:yes stop_codon:yes gene_type:complete